MFTQQWHRPHITGSRKQRTLQEALFVLEKNACNFGTANKSSSSLQEQKEALETITDYSRSSRLKKVLEDSKLSDSLLKILKPSGDSNFEMLSEKQTKQLQISSVKLLAKLISLKGEKEKQNHATDYVTKISNLGLGGSLANIIDNTEDISEFEEIKRLIVAIYGSMSWSRLEGSSATDLFSCIYKLAIKLNAMTMEAATVHNREVVAVLYKILKNKKKMAVVSGAASGAEISSVVVTHLLKTLGTPLAKVGKKPMEVLLELSENQEGCRTILENEGVKKVVRRLLRSSVKNKEKRAGVQVLKNILKLDNSSNGIKVYDEILKEGKVNSLDAFVEREENTNKDFKKRMIKQQKLQRTQMRTRMRKKAGVSPAFTVLPKKSLTIKSIPTDGGLEL